MHRMCQIFLWNVSVWSDKLQQQSKDKSVNLLDEIHLLSNSLQDSIFYFCTTVEISLIIPRHLVILWFPQSNKNTKKSCLCWQKEGEKLLVSSSMNDRMDSYTICADAYWQKMGWIEKKLGIKWCTTSDLGFICNSKYAYIT